jgi:transposase-like protein
MLCGHWQVTTEQLLCNKLCKGCGVLCLMLPAGIMILQVLNKATGIMSDTETKAVCARKVAGHCLHCNSTHR